MSHSKYQQDSAAIVAIADFASGAVTSANADSDRYLTSVQVRERYGNASDMWIWRRLHDGSGFPEPVEFCGRRLWKLSELITWEKLPKMPSKRRAPARPSDAGVTA